MSKWYEVEMQVLIVYAVEVNDNENEIHANDAAWNDYQGKGRVTCTAKPLPAKYLGMIAEHSDRILPLENSKFFENYGEEDEPA